MNAKTLAAMSLLSLTAAFAGCGDNSAPAPAAAPTTASSATSATATEAQKLIDQATDYIKNNKLDLADKAVTQLQTMKASLPPEYGPKIDQLKTMLDQAKAAGGALPGGIKMP